MRKVAGTTLGKWGSILLGPLGASMCPESLQIPPKDKRAEIFLYLPVPLQGCLLLIYFFKILFIYS